MATNASGIVGDGEDRYIPGSRRPDGTYRKERKVRPGFTPAEDVVRYSNTRIEASKPSQYPPGYTPKTKPVAPSGGKKKANKTEKGDSTAAPSRQQDTKSAEAPGTTPLANPTLSPATEMEKRIKALQKKLRQIDELKAKKSSGTSLNAEQLDKIAKAKSLEEELSKLQI
ncbi:partner of Y14 and mago [Umbelopsis sp. PMI_123]|nr:partner of Y14 and mago [Umbelopsis sp. PMI_123]